MAWQHYTPTETKILKLLSDGQRHLNVHVLEQCLPDPQYSTMSNLRSHVGNLRGKLRPVGEDIVAERIKGKWFYRRVKLL